MFYSDVKDDMMKIIQLICEYHSHCTIDPKMPPMTKILCSALKQYYTEMRVQPLVSIRNDIKHSDNNIISVTSSMERTTLAVHDDSTLDEVKLTDELDKEDPIDCAFVMFDFDDFPLKTIPKDKNERSKMIMKVILKLVDKTNKLKKLPSSMTQYNCSSHGNDPINECDSIKRLLSLLDMYSHLDVINNTAHQNMFMQQMDDNEECKGFLNDYIHFISDHGHQLELINESMDPCDIYKCKCVSRHYTRNESPNTTEQINDTNELLNFYISIMDSMHIFVFHLFDVGLRVRSTSPIESNEDESQDEQFSRICFQVNACREISKSFRRFRSNSKFKFTTGSAANTKLFLDVLMLTLVEKETSSDIITKLQNFIGIEDYDTDSIQMDIEDNIGNIQNEIGDRTIMSTMTQFIMSNKRMSC